MGLYTSVASAVEANGSQSEDYDYDNNSATASVTLKVPAADRHAVVNDVLGHGYLWPHGSSPAIASRASIKPDANSRGTAVSGNTGIVHDEYLVTIYYTTKQPQGGQQTDPITGDVFSEELEPTIEHMKLDYKSFRWESGARLKENEAPVRRHEGFNLVRTIYNMHPPLPLALLDIQGCCNQNAYFSPTLGLSFAEETLLAASPKISRKFSLGTGFSGINLSLKFSYRKHPGWNKFWNPDKPDLDDGNEKWDKIIVVVDDEEYKNYPAIDMSWFLF
jgi:hypothetical protein